MENEIEGLKKEKYRLSEQLKEAKDRVDLLSEKYTESRQELERSKTERSNLKVEYDRYTPSVVIGHFVIELHRYRREVMTKMENSTEMFEELTRQTDQLRQNGISMMLPRQGSLTDQVITFVVNEHKRSLL
jgi:predicted nuclease with TOPRIM domain